MSDEQLDSDVAFILRAFVRTGAAIDAPYFAERLRVVLAKRNISGAELARRIGVSREAASAWMRGKCPPRPKQVLKIVKAVEIEASWLLSPHPVDLHGRATDDMRESLIGWFVAGVLSEGQTARATGLDRIEVRKRAHARIDALYGAETERSDV